LVPDKPVKIPPANIPKEEEEGESPLVEDPFLHVELGDRTGGQQVRVGASLGPLPIPAVLVSLK